MVETILVGKERVFNRRFMAMANHYLFEPVACTPASGWEKGQVENQIGNVREWLFTPMIRFASFAALNDWLATRCRELAQRPYSTETSRRIAECFAREQPQLRAISATFDGYVEQMLRASSACLVRVDRNCYSVPAELAGKAVSMRGIKDWPGLARNTLGAGVVVQQLIPRKVLDFTSQQVVVHMLKVAPDHYWTKRAAFEAYV